MKASAIPPDAIDFTQHRAEEPALSRRLTLASRNTARDDGVEPPAHLTPRQLEVLALLCEGLPNKLICRRLDISPGTVKAHISSILRELGVVSRLQAVVASRRRGLVGEALSGQPHLGDELFQARNVGYHEGAPVALHQPLPDHR